MNTLVSTTIGNVTAIRTEHGYQTLKYTVRRTESAGEEVGTIQVDGRNIAFHAKQTYQGLDRWDLQDLVRIMDEIKDSLPSNLWVAEQKS